MVLNGRIPARGNLVGLYGNEDTERMQRGATRITSGDLATRERLPTNLRPARYPSGRTTRSLSSVASTRDVRARSCRWVSNSCLCLFWQLWGQHSLPGVPKEVGHPRRACARREVQRRNRPRRYPPIQRRHHQLEGGCHICRFYL